MNSYIQKHNNIRHIHFIGIAGTAMGSAAIELKRNGFHITGSDEHVYPPMSEMLHRANIMYYEDFNTAHLNAAPDLIVIGNAVSRGNCEAEEVLSRNIPYVSLPELISAHFIAGKKSLVITGTHGKSTISTLSAWIFEKCGKNPGYMVGAVPIDLNQSCKLDKGEVFIIEGDEYDTAFFDKRSKFLHYSPDCLIINNIELDHVDIFTDFEDIRKSFYNVINIVPSTGVIIANFDDRNVKLLVTEHPVVKKNLVPVISYGTQGDTACRISNISYQNGNIAFDLTDKDDVKINIGTRLCGGFQAYNVAAAVISAVEFGIPIDSIINAVQMFKGIKRRMEITGTASGITVIDDFAHHPTAIVGTLIGAKKRYPDKKIWAVIEPRSNSMRRNIFQNQLVEALQVADAVILAGVDRPEKIPENERLCPEKVVKDLKNAGNIAVYIPMVDDIIDYIHDKAEPGDVVIGMSNGGFGNFHHKLLNRLS